MNKLANLINHIQNHLFRSIISNNLVYNACWEDPRIDRRLLQMKKNSKVVMLTSAGCNALDYMLDDPQKIYCVDVNPAQNALMEFKKALFRLGNYLLLWEFFGEGKKQGAELIYRRKLRKVLQGEHRPYWDRSIRYFTPSFSQPGFYFRGTSGKVALMVRNKLKRKGLYPGILKLLEAQTLDEQRYYFEEIEPRLWDKSQKWLIRQPATMSLLGVPAAQRQMIEDRYRGGLLEYIRKALERVFTRLPVSDNYFWRVYISGSYSKRCCPNYLVEQNFRQLRQNINRITTFTTTLLKFLRRNPGTYSHFVLLDHMDWMAGSRPEILAREWKEILKSSRPGSRILFRSAGPVLDYLPAFVFDRVQFRTNLTEQLHPDDRVGTYEATYLGIVQ